MLKIERPGAGDDKRDSSYYLFRNRAKKSMTLDISKPECREIVRALAAKCHVLIENYKVGTLVRHNLSYDALREINPRLIYYTIIGFCQ